MQHALDTPWLRTVVAFTGLLASYYRKFLMDVKEMLKFYEPDLRNPARQAAANVLIV